MADEFNIIDLDLVKIYKQNYEKRILELCREVKEDAKNERNGLRIESTKETR